MMPTSFDAYLRSRGIGVRWLSRASGVSAPAIRKWRNGGTYPQIDKAKAVAVTLGIPLGELADMILEEDVGEDAGRGVEGRPEIAGGEAGGAGGDR